MIKTTKTKTISSGRMLGASIYTGGGHLPPGTADRNNNRMMRRLKGERGRKN